MNIGAFSLSEASAEESRLLRTLVVLAQEQQLTPSLLAHPSLGYPYWRLKCSWMELSRAYCDKSMGLMNLVTLQNVLMDLSGRSIIGGDNFTEDCGPAIAVQRVYEDPAGTILAHLQIDISALAGQF